MKYWLYSNGKMSGPFEAQELLLNPEFSPDSMVCESSKSGGNPQDWQRASSVPELSEFAVLTAQGEDNSSLDSLGKSDDSVFSHPNILDTIDDTISDLEFLKEIEQKDDDIDAFDLKVTQIKEQLETAVWEKNLLLEKIKIKEERENEYKEKIKELEAKIDELMKSSLKRAYELSGLNEKKEEVKIEKDISPKTKEKSDEIQHYTLKDRSVEDKKDISEVKKTITENVDNKKEEEMENEKQKARPVIEEPKVFKKISAYSDNFSFGNERVIDSISSEKDDIEVFELKSFGMNKLEANPYSTFEDKKEANPDLTFENKKEEEPVDIIKISVSKKEEVKQETLNLNTQPPELKQEDNLAKENFSDDNKIVNTESLISPVQPQETIDFSTPSPATIVSEIKLNEISVKKEEDSAKNKAEPEKIEVGQSAFSNISEIKIDISPAAKTPVIDIPAFKNIHEKKEEIEPEKSKASLEPAKPVEPIAPMPGPSDVTQRVNIKDFAKQTVVSNPRKTAYSPKKNKIKLYISLAVSVLIIIGGIVFLADFRKSSKKSNLMVASSSLSQEPNHRESIEENVNDSTQKTNPTDIAVSSVSVAGKDKEMPEKNEAVFSSGQGVKNAIEAVKNFNLSNGRGTISNWFSNSFASSGQSREEWSATLLQGKVFVVQYRLIRPKQEPLVYQFEVNAETGQILRGINNNAIDLLESGDTKSVKKADKPVKKPISFPKKKSHPKAYAPAPLPDRDESDYQEPTGFEDSQLISKARVKITAPETDEELF